MHELLYPLVVVMMSAPRRAVKGTQGRSLGPVAVAGIVIVGGSVTLLLAATFPGRGTFGWGMMRNGSSSWGWMWAAWVLLLAVPLFLVLGLLVVLGRPRAEPVPLVFSPEGPPGRRMAGGQVADDQYYRSLEDLAESRWRGA